MHTSHSTPFLLIYSHEYPPFAGGVATYSYEYALALTNLGINVLVLAPEYSREDVSFDKKQSFKTIRMKLTNNRSSYLNHLIGIYYYIKVLLEYRISKVFLTDYYSQRTVALFHMLGFKKYVVAVHGTEILDNLSTSFKKYLFKDIYIKSESIICISNYTKDRLLEYGLKNLGAKIRVIYNGIDIIRYSRPKNESRIKEIKKKYNLIDKTVIISICRLSQRKGIEHVIKAMPLVRQEKERAAYLICGIGEYESYLRKLTKELDLEDVVRFAGAIAEESKIDYYDASDIFIMLSQQKKNDYEGFGISYLEAAARKIPAIGSNHGGIPEAVINGETGILLNDLDPITVARVIVKLIDDDNYRNSLGEEGYRRCEKDLNWHILVKSNLDLFGETK